VPPVIGIYCITQRTSGKVYVGQSIDVHKRISRHKNPKRKNHHAIGLAILKYGVEEFDFEVIETCRRDDLNIREVYWINTLGTMSPYGYNLNGGGGAATSVSEETRAKMVESWKSRKPASDETREKIRLAGVGRVHSEASKSKISAANKGRASTGKGVPRSESTRAKIGAARKGHTHSAETRAKLSAAQFGRPAKNRKSVMRSDGIMFAAVSMAADAIGVCNASVGGCLSGRLSTVKGFSFKYA